MLSQEDKFNNSKAPIKHWNYSDYNKQSNGYYVIRTKNNDADNNMSKRLERLDKKLNKILINLDVLVNYPEVARLLRMDSFLNGGLELLKTYHTGTKSLAELEWRNSPNFFGVNYPYGVSETGSFPLGTDRFLRARSRKIYLGIRNSTPFETDKLIVHELSHTICNDVVYRAVHSDNFKKAEILMKTLWYSKNIKSL